MRHSEARLTESVLLLSSLYLMNKSGILTVKFIKIISIIKKMFLTRDNKTDYICLSLFSWWASVVSPWHTFCKKPSQGFSDLPLSAQKAECCSFSGQNRTAAVGTWLFLSISYKILQPWLLMFNIHKSCCLPHLPLGGTKEQQRLLI